METNVKPSSPKSGWTYTEIVVYDRNRVLNPTHVSGDEISFREAPRLLSSEISICVTNGDRQTTRAARVLPHDPNSTRIPIQLIPSQQLSTTELTA